MFPFPFKLGHKANNSTPTIADEYAAKNENENRHREECTD